MNNTVSNTDLEKKYQETYFKESDLFTLKSIQNVNYKPHPYTIGPTHVTYAADHCGGMLGKETLEKVPCAHLGCTLSYDEHISDKVMFVQLKRNTTGKEAGTFLMQMEEEILKDGIDGFSFVETPENFRLTE
jgi:hypothetical protein